MMMEVEFGAAPLMLSSRGSCVSEYLVEESDMEQAAAFFVACVMADGHVFNVGLRGCCECSSSAAHSHLHSSKVERRVQLRRDTTMFWMITFLRNWTNLMQPTRQTSLPERNVVRGSHGGLGPYGFERAVFGPTHSAGSLEAAQPLEFNRLLSFQLLRDGPSSCGPNTPISRTITAAI